MDVGETSILDPYVPRKRITTNRWCGAIGIFGRALFTFEFWSSALTKLLDFPEALNEMHHFNLSPPPAYAVATIVTQLLGSALVIRGGRLMWLGAAILLIFTAATIPIAHAYWLLPRGEARMQEVQVTAEHLTVIGAALLMMCQGHFCGRGAHRLIDPWNGAKDHDDHFN
jgi:transmembrane protein